MSATIKTITADEIEAIDWRTLNTHVYGPIAKESDDLVSLAMVVDGATVAYLVADGSDLWHIEVNAAHRGHGYAKRLIAEAKISFAWEVCSDESANLLESLNINFEDVR